MMMSVGPKIGIASNPFETAPAEAAAGAAGMGDIFLKMLAGMGTPLTVATDGDASPAASVAVEGQENLTIKTFQKLLGAKAGETEPQSAPGDEELTQDEADKLAEGTDAAAILSLGVVVPTPLAPPTVAAGAKAPTADGVTKAPAADIGAAPSPLQTIGKGGSAAQALLAAAFATSPAAAVNVSAQAVGGKASEPGAGIENSAAEPFVKLAAMLKTAVPTEGEQPSLPEAVKLASMKPAAGGAPSPQQALSDMAAPAEIGSADTGQTQGTTVASTLTSILSASLQPVVAQPAPVDVAAATAQPGEVVDTTLEQQLDLAHEGEWLDRLARDIARTAGAEGGLRFRLNPEHLGSLHVELTQGQAGTSLKLTADTESARAIIADAQPRLVAEARAQGVRIAETHVDLGAGGHSAAGEQRRHEGERPQAFVRTSQDGARQEHEVSRSAVNASERYA